jgi:uncharacterized YccA/Bax inhibitor family protein
MALSNPAFGARSFPVATANSPTMTPEKLEELYGRPSAGPAETDRMSYEDTTVKTLVTLLFVLLGGTVGFFIPALALPFALVGFVLALVNIFKKKPSAPLVLAYGAAQGIFVGGISRIIENNYEGIIYQALLGTGIVFGVTLALFASGRIRASKRATKIFMIAMISYALFSVVNLVLQFTGVSTDPWGLASAPVPFIGIPFGLIIGPLAILLGAYSLVLDFTAVQEGVRTGAPRSWGWKAAFGIVLTIIWLYVEILRLLSIIRGD